MFRASAFWSWNVSIFRLPAVVVSRSVMSSMTASTVNTVTVAGWLSHDDGTRFLFEGAGHLRYDRPLRSRADVFEVGVTNSIGFAALDAAVEVLLSIGVPNIYAHVQRLLDELEPILVERGFRSVRRVERDARSCILSVLPPDGIDLATFARALAPRGVAVATPDGHLRFSPHWPNDPGQIELLATALDGALAEQIRRC